MKASSATRDPFSVRNRVACVTGASSGLGRASASFLVRAGARVVGVARDEDRLKDWRREAGHGRTAAVVADLAELVRVASKDSDADDDIDIDALTTDVRDRVSAPFGPPEILVNAAGINPRRPADSVSRSDWHRTLDLNLSVPFFLTRALVPAMRQAGWGRVVNFASLQSRRAFPNGIAYGASKGGVEQLTRAMAEAWSRDGVLVNALAPGFFPTPLTAPLFAEPTAVGRLAAATCLGRNGEPADLEGPLIFFCSDACRYVTGQLLFVDGGFMVQ
ncbi:MAG: SDR family oxidoreductase [Paracoccaceae bacterium]|nr:SDR family oxidoreductase [Paracoccaceae bacterium]